MVPMMLAAGAAIGLACAAVRQLSHPGSSLALTGLMASAAHSDLRPETA